MASQKDSAEEDGIKDIRFRRIEENIKSLSRFNITETYEEILEILAEGEISCPKEGSSIAEKLVDIWWSWYKEPNLAMLIKVLLPLDADISTRLLEHIGEKILYLGPRKHIHYLNLTTVLIHEGANIFHLFGQKTVFNEILYYSLPNSKPYAVFDSQTDSDSSPVQSLWSSLTDFLEATFSRWEVSNTNFLNDVIKGVPHRIFEGDSSHIAAIKELIVKKCLKVIETNPAVCDHVDEEGKTPLHSLIEKFILWRTRNIVAGRDILWDLLSQLITENNVNAKDKDQRTPYDCFLLWLDSISDLQSVNALVQLDLEETAEIEKLEFESLKERVKKIDKQIFQEKGARKTDTLQEIKSAHRSRRIKEKIDSLTSSNITQEYEAILEILAEGEISCPEEESPIGKELACKLNDLCEEPTYAKLVKVLLPLDADMSTRLLEEIEYNCYLGHRKQSCFLNLTTILIREGANPFHLIRGTTFFNRILDYFVSDTDSTSNSNSNSDSDLSFDQSLLFPLTDFLEATFSRFEVSNTNFLNDVIKGVPSHIFEGDSSHVAAIKELIVKKCLKVIETNPAVCDHVHEEGKTPLHNLIEKVLMDGLWGKAKIVAGSDILWDLLSQMITEKNVNAKDKDQVTPYDCFLLWQYLTSGLQTTAALDQQDVEKTEEIKQLEFMDLKEKVKKIDEQHFRGKGARKSDALQGLKSAQ